MAMTLLDPKAYRRACDCFSALDFHLSVSALLDGVVPGSVYVNDPQHPTAALMRCGHRFTLAGDPGDESFVLDLAQFFSSQVYGPQGTGGEGFMLYYAPGWETAIELVILHGRKLYPGWRQYYEFEAPHQDWRSLVPPDFALVPVDEALLARTDIDGLDALREEMCSERPSVAEFLKHSFGVSLLHQNALVTWCLSEYNLRDRCEVGIATMQEYRRRGLATASGLAFVEMAHSHGIKRIGWHCWAANHGSVKSALRIGFKKVTDYPSYFAPFHE